MAEYKDIAPLKKQIADVKKAVRSPNSDYLTGYLCALSATEGIIAELPTADVVEVVRCKDCVYCDLDGRCEAPENGLIREYIKPDDYCSYGRKE